MTQADTSQAQDRYNSIAVKYADKLEQLKTDMQKQGKRPDRTVEQLFAPHTRSGLGVYLEYQRMGNAAVSAELQARAEGLGIEFEHLGMTVGTVIHRIDLKETLSAELIQLVRDTLLERKVVFFRDQNLTEDEHVAFGRCFGGLDAFPFGKSGTNPFILEIHHGKRSPGAENVWHTDVTWMENPSLGSIAQCIEVPPLGGDTLFSDSHASYFGLPTELQERLQHIAGINDYRVFVMGRGLPDELIEGFKSEIPFGVSHPLLRTHPETGKTALYLHGGFLRHESLYDLRSGETLEEAESRRIVAFLLQQHPRPEYTCRFKWAPGSIAFWDNRAVQHYAASDYYPHRRLLRRVTVSGDKPFYDPTPGA